MNRPLLLAALACAPALASCGASDEAAPLAVGPRLTAAQAQPRAAVAPGALATIADTTESRTRIGFVNVAALEDLGDAVDQARVRTVVLGSGAVRLDDATDAPSTAVQVGSATVLGGEARTVIGGDSTLRAALASDRPKPNAIEDETPSAVQSCLGDTAAQTLVGPGRLGTKSAIGVGLVDTRDAPSGPKLVVCAAPHFFRDLHVVEDRLHRLFPDAGRPAAQRPVIAEQEIGERDVMGAAVALDQVDPQLVRALLSGGPRLVQLGAAGPAGGPGADHGPH